MNSIYNLSLTGIVIVVGIYWYILYKDTKDYDKLKEKHKK